MSEILDGKAAVKAATDDRGAGGAMTIAMLMANTLTAARRAARFH